MFRKMHVYDVDGVLLNSAHRHKFNISGELNVEHYFNNLTPEMLKKDSVLPLAKQYIKDCINPEIYCVICSVRSMNHDQLFSIAEKIGLPDKLMLVGEHEPPLAPSQFLKRAALVRLFNLKQFRNIPRFFWDDSEKNLEATKDLFTNSFLVKTRTCGQ